MLIQTFRTVVSTIWNKRFTIYATKEKQSLEYD